MDDEELALPDPYPHFERDFQRFMQGEFTQVLDEEMERYYAQHPKNKPSECPHGRTKLTCPDCYFNGPGYK